MQLVRSENAWKSHTLDTSTTKEATREAALLRKQVSGDLNKITLERFDPISQRMRENLLKLGTEELPVFVSELLTHVCFLVVKECCIERETVLHLYLYLHIYI